jgi:uncharacterized membrane protein
MADKATEKPDIGSSHRKIVWIAATAVCTALFVVLTLCLQVPVFENYYLCLGYIIMAVCLYSVGTVSGTFVGIAGIVLYCLITSGVRGMPGWAIGNLVIGIIVGITFKLTRRLRQKWLQALLNFIAIAVSVALGILILKSLTECILYGQPMVVRMGKNVFAFVADIFVLELSLPICMALDRPVRKLLKL